MSKCFECHFWKQEAELPQGYCGLGSVTCITAVFNGKPATRFMKKSEVKPISEPKRSNENKVKGQTIFMTNKALVVAQQNKQRQVVQYPDMKELTDESKKQMRKRRT